MPRRSTTSTISAMPPHVSLLAWMWCVGVLRVRQPQNAIKGCGRRKAGKARRIVSLPVTIVFSHCTPFAFHPQVAINPWEE